MSTTAKVNTMPKYRYFLIGNLLFLKNQYALCAINHRVTEVSKYWMAQTTFQNTQKLAVLDLHDGSVLWEDRDQDGYPFPPISKFQNILPHPLLIQLDSDQSSPYRRPANPPHIVQFHFVRVSRSRRRAISNE